MPGFKFFITPLFLLLFLVGCSGKDEAPNFDEMSAKEIYSSAEKLLEERKFVSSAKRFEEVIRQHPYSKWSKKAHLMTAYAYFKAEEFTETTTAISAFVQLYPASPDVAYALYLKGLSYYMQIAGVDRDEEMAAKALFAFQELIKRFPESTYSKDAKLKIDLAYEFISGTSMNIGRLYQRNNLYLGAINRFLDVLNSYQTTTHVPEAMYRLTELYLTLGLDKEAKDIAKVMSFNFPGNEWYKRAYDLLKSYDILPPVSKG